MVKFDELFGESAEGFKPDKKKRVGGYILGKTLGEGSFAKVRIASHVLTSEKVAVKVINKKLIVKREYVRKNMRREAVMLQRMEHPHIVKLYEVMETENSFYMVTELAEGGDFMKYLTVKQCLTESETRRYMRQIVSAVDHMHRSGVVHRDLKIENLLLDKDMNIKIIDFGLSNHWDGQSLLSTQCGSPAYAAPEIFSKKQYGPSVDIWSIGINMFAMLTGRLPFLVDPPTNLTKLHALILKGCAVPEEFTPSCQDLLSRLLNPTVAGRIKVREMMSHPWINEGYIPLQAWGLKSKIVHEDINQTAVNFMVYYLNLKEADIRDAVMNCKPNSITGTYYLLNERVIKGLALPDENVMGQGQRKDVVDEMKRHHVVVVSNDKPNGVVVAPVQRPEETTSKVQLTQDAGQTPRFPAISHRESSSSRHRHSSRYSNPSLSAKKRSHSHEVLSSLQQGITTARPDPDNKENNTLILQDLDHIIKDLGGEGDANPAHTPRETYKECMKILNHTGTMGKRSKPKAPNKGILKREKATSMPESLNIMKEHTTLFNQRADMESPGSNKSVRFQSSANLHRKQSDASSYVSDRYVPPERQSSDRRSMGAHSYHYNARLQAEMEALNRLEPLDRTSSLQSLPIQRRESANSVDRMSLTGVPPSNTSVMGIKREYSSVQDVNTELLRQHSGATDRSSAKHEYDKYRVKVRNLEGDRTLILDLKTVDHQSNGEQPMGNRSNTMPDLRPPGQAHRKLGSIGGDRSKMEAGGSRSRPLRRQDSRDSQKSDTSVSMKNLGAIYTMPDYTDPLVKAPRSRRTVVDPPPAPSSSSASSSSAMPVKWRDSSRHSLRNGRVKEANARPKDIYNEYITQKQSLSYHHTTMPSVLQTQK